MQRTKGIALLVGLKRVNPANYNGWDGENGCWGCELDVDNITRILAPQGFDINIMKTESATHDNILNKLTSIANTINNDDIFVFYYSGHGGQQVDRDSDELDGHDETLVAYDQEIIDDELYQRFKLFPAGTRIVMISDSCNSGTNYKNVRDVSFVKASPICPIPESLINREDVSFQMIHMGGCRDGATSQGYYGGGAFTIALCEAWANGAFRGSYKDWFDKAQKIIRSPQRPQYNEFGRVTEAFLSQKPFTIESQIVRDEDEQTVWQAIEIMNQMGILPVSLEEDLVTAVSEVFPPTGDENIFDGGISGPQPWLDEQEAILIAQSEVDGMASGSDDTWSIGAQVTKAFPIFIPGQALPSYYECKVIDAKGQDAGYVLVNVDRTDLLIPEATVEGLTTTERYQQRLPGKELKIIRMDWVRSVAVEPGARNFDNSLAILDTEGFIVDEDQQKRGNSQGKLLADYFEAYESSSCFPFYDHVLLDEYYAELEDEIELLRGFGTRAARGKTRTIRASLSGKFSCGWHTPAWKQFDKPNGSAIGCGNTAWAIALAYFKQFHGKSRLFDGVNVNTTSMSDEIKDCMKRCAVLCDTWDVADQGLTWPWKMQRGIGYAKDKGYSNSSCARKRGSEYSKFGKVKKHLRSNKPCILLMHHDGIGVADHYVVIEAALKTQRKYWRKWHNRNVKYLCNFGWGNTRKWICVRDWGVNQNKVYSSLSIFLPNVY